MIEQLGTGKAQPCDVGYQRPLKHIIRVECIKYLAEQTKRQLDAGVKPESIRLDFTRRTLRNACTNWLLTAWNWFDSNPEVICSAWSQAKFGDTWNLSYQFLTGEYALRTVRERYDEDIPFALSLATPISVDEDLETNTEGQEFDDDPALPPQAINDLQINGSGSVLIAHSAVIDDGLFVYNADGDLTDDDAEGETDVESEASLLEPPPAFRYRQVSAMSSSSSLADRDSHDEPSESEADAPLPQRLDSRFRAPSEIVVPDDLIGKAFIIE